MLDDIGSVLLGIELRSHIRTIYVSRTYFKIADAAGLRHVRRVLAARIAILLGTGRILRPVQSYSFGRGQVEYEIPREDGAGDLFGYYWFGH